MNSAITYAIISIAFGIISIAGLADDFIRQAVEGHRGELTGAFVATISIIGALAFAFRAAWVA